MISSQSRIVLSRWATRMQVMPRRRTAVENLVLALGIQGGGRLVEHQNGRLADQRPRDLDALALAAVEIAAALLDHALEIAGQCLDDGRQSCIVDRGDEASMIDGVVPQGDVVWTVPLNRRMS